MISGLTTSRAIIIESSLLKAIEGQEPRFMRETIYFAVIGVGDMGVETSSILLKHVVCA
jgi:hypothetical protein